ncbi:hypothetical protein REPUB_Repub07fG0215600 [Reevesia pubescens]
MASRAVASTALLLALNLLFFTLVTSNYVPCPPPPKSKPSHKSPPPPAPKNSHKSPPPPATKPSPKSPPPPAPQKPATCPRDTLNLGVCADLLNIVHVVVGNPAKTPCCTLLSGLADVEAAICLCTALKANLLGINLNIPVSLSLLLNYCGKKAPAGYKCA